MDVLQKILVRFGSPQKIVVFTKQGEPLPSVFDIEKESELSVCGLSAARLIDQSFRLTYQLFLCTYVSPCDSCNRQSAGTSTDGRCKHGDSGIDCEKQCATPLCSLDV